MLSLDFYYLTMLSYPIKNGAYYDPRFADVMPDGTVMPLDEQQDEAESKALVQMMNTIRTARTIAL